MQIWPKGRLRRFVCAFSIMTIMFCVFGAGLNLLVAYANDEKMPVAMRSEDVLWWVNIDRMSLVLDSEHSALTEQTRFAFFADRIVVRLPNFIEMKVPKIIHRYAFVNGYPMRGGDYSASIGDVFIILYYLSAPFAILMSILVLLQNAYRRMTHRR